MWVGARWHGSALIALLSLSACFFLTDFDDLSGSEAAGGAGPSASVSGVGGAASGSGGGVGGMTGTGGIGGQPAGTGGTAGAGGAPPPPDVVINELVSDPLMGDEDWIEFYNASANAVDISGWYFDDVSNQFTFPPNTVLGPDSYLVLDRGAPNSFTFGFSKDGETIRLFTDGGMPVDTTTWTAGQGAQPNSWGRLPNGTGTFQTLTPTKGGANQ